MSLGLAVYVVVASSACVLLQIHEGVEDAGAFSAFIALLASSVGQFLVINMLVSLALLSHNVLQQAIFGKLRAIEWQRLWERLVSYVMGQLIVLGAVVEPDMAEMGLWGSFSALVGLLGLYAGAPLRRTQRWASQRVARPP